MARSIEPSVRWNLGNRLELFVSYDYRTLDVEGGRLFREGYFRLSLVRQLWKRSFVRLTLVDDSIHRDAELYLFSDEDELEQEDTAELVLGWIPLRRHRIYIGVDAVLIDSDALNGSKLEATTFFFKYSRRFRL